MKPTTRVVAAATIFCFAAIAQAQTLKPGLWEIDNKTQSSSGQMEQAMAQAQQAMASMPPEQRKRMEEMMARQGVSVGSGGLGRSARICMSKEMVESSQLPAQEKGDCKTTYSSRVGNTMKMAFSCTQPPASGEGQITFVSPESYRMQMVSTTTLQGKPEKMTMDSTGKWLSADCGTLKPIPLNR